LLCHHKSLSRALENSHGHHDAGFRPGGLDRRDAIVRRLRAIVPGEGVIDSAAEMLPLRVRWPDGVPQPPMVVVLPGHHGTGLESPEILLRAGHQGGAARLRHLAVRRRAAAGRRRAAGLGKFKRIREIDFDNRVVVTEPGVTNLAISQAVAHAGFYYAPDPSSQIACSIGGNVAENSGGVHCLKYGMTTNNVLGCEIVLMSGEILRIGGKARRTPATT
jgi:glycolate oxidase